jgi:N-acetyl-gamma-glutamyl-phosphate reductase
MADCKSGVSGAGREATPTTHFCHVNESFKALQGRWPSSHAGNRGKYFLARAPVKITFVPHLIPMTRGMESTVYANLSAGDR